MSDRASSEAVVRWAQSRDLAGVLHVHAPTDPGPDPAAPTDLERATWLQMLATENLSVYVATPVADDAHVVGTATMLVMPNLGYDCRPSAFIEAMVVAGAHRRQG